MPTLRSSVLIIDHPQPDHVGFGADFATDLKFAEAQCAEFIYPVIVLSGSRKMQSLEFLDHLNRISPQSQRVIIQEETPAETLRLMINKGNVFKILPAFNDQQFDFTIQEALEEFRLIQQNQKLLQLVNEQNDRLKKLTIDLEDRVEKRQKFLEDAKEKLLVTNHRVEALHRALVAVHRAGSIAEMERLTNEALSGALGLSWTRIQFHQPSQTLSERVFSLFTAPLMRGKEVLGQIYFARDLNRPFSKDESSFLNQVADAVSLAIDRLAKLEQSESLKHQWEATFDAIREPVSLINNQYTVVRINRAFADHSGTEPEKIIGRKCYEALFSREQPCENCQVGKNFRLKPMRTNSGQSIILDVFSQEIQFKPEGTELYVNMYHDISEQLRLERKILESAKMAELGTIGSSIAHELNNPLGGMLSFLQLIKMDLKGDEPYFSDIDEMEKGARRCRDIVQSLLGFTRKSGSDETGLVDLREVVAQALKITELQTRAMGITVRLDLPDETAPVAGQFNFLAQALRNFLQNAQEAIAERMKKQIRFQGEIHLRITHELDRYLLEINDNGAGFDPKVSEQIYDPLYTTKNSVANPGLGLTVAQQIIIDHGGQLEISSSTSKGTTAKISFPMPPPGQT